MLNHLDGVEAIEVRTPKDLETVDRLIIPGGESTTVGLLMQRFGLAGAVSERAMKGMPIWGTCMGMILLANSIEDRSDQFTLNLIDIIVRRNAFGTQVNSFVSSVFFEPLDRSIDAVFIRAPIVARLGKEVQTLATFDEQVIAVQHNNILGTSFHPELSGDSGVHEYFMSL
jgi:5'-phosphate synthase pdxT subunit